jgi:hypothetical protein
VAGLLAKFFGRTASEGAAFAMGTAVAPALRPLVQDIYNETWSAHPSRPVDAALLATGVSTRQLDPAWAKAEAQRTGISGDRFDRMVLAFDTGPGVAVAFQLWRRGVISEAGFRKAAGREGLEAEWIDDLVQLHDVLLSPQDLAMARQQGFVDVGRQHDESARQGVNAERADLLFEMSGLPPGIETALDMLRRSIIGEPEFGQIVREGHTKTKYTDELLALRMQLLNSATIVNLYLRGWITQADYHARMAKHGYSAADADDWFDSAGRPAAPVQMFTAWARGVDGPDGVPMDRSQFLKGIRESDIRPEWGPMLWGIRHAYPSLFQLRRAVQDGGISRARALDILRFERYEDSDALAMVNSWLADTGAGAKGLTAAELVAEYEGLYITRAELVADLQAMGYSAAAAEGKAKAADARRVRTHRNAAITAIRRRYESWRATETDVQARLTELKVTPEAQTHLLELWGFEREDKVRLLTPAQVKKAWKDGLYSRDAALVELEHLGYTAADAATLLDE